MVGTVRFVGVFKVVYLILAGAWFGSMAYSLAVVQPKVAGFFAEDRRREEFLITLANGNRWPVVGLLGALGLSGAGAVITGSAGVRAGYLVALGLDAVAAGIFWYVSWRHWPARVFALPSELPAYRSRLRACALAMTGLAAAAFVVATSVSVG